MPHASLPRTRATGPVRSTSSTALPAPADAPITVRPCSLRAPMHEAERRLRLSPAAGTLPRRSRERSSVHRGRRCRLRRERLRLPLQPPSAPAFRRCPDPSRPTARARDRPIPEGPEDRLPGWPPRRRRPAASTESDIASRTASPTSTTPAPFAARSSINRQRRGASSVTNRSWTSAPDRRASPIANGPSTRKAAGTFRVPNDVAVCAPL